MTKDELKTMKAAITKEMRKACEAAVEALGPKTANQVMAYRRGGECAICGRKSQDRLLPRDHHHISGKFRGLLCTFCNLALGYIKDDPATADAMAAYLRKGPVLGDEHMINFDEE